MCAFVELVVFRFHQSPYNTHISSANKERRIQCRRKTTWQCALSSKSQSKTTELDDLLHTLTTTRYLASQSQTSGIHALDAHQWVKLICGASMQDVVKCRNLALVYSLVGVDCIDCAADVAVVDAVKQGVELADRMIRKIGQDGNWNKPLIMVSVNDDEDPHFRKAYFDPQRCPSDCPRPCELSCPANAIHNLGVIEPKCYGCGRCIPVCPLNLIETQSFTQPHDRVIQLVLEQDIDAMEIHTRPHGTTAFGKLWQSVGKHVRNQLKLIAVSFQDMDNLGEELQTMHNILAMTEDQDQEQKPKQEQKPEIPFKLVWQTDGRPMSGDIGKGTAHASFKLASKVLEEIDQRTLGGYVQLAGGTNHHTHELIQENGLGRKVAGVAFGGVARKILAPIFDVLAERDVLERIELHPELLFQAVQLANELVGPYKARS